MEKIDYYKRSLWESPRDNKRKKVYRWGHKLRKELPTLRVGSIQAVVDSLCGVFEVEAPVVEFSRKRKQVACYAPVYHKIQLPLEEPWAHNLEIVIHETAHAVVRQLMKADRYSSWIAREQSHGPNFVAVNIALLVAATGNGESIYKRSASEYGIKIGSIWNLIN